MDRQRLIHSAERHGHNGTEMRGHQTSSLTEQTTRFMQTLNEEVYGYLQSAAMARGVTVQGLIRAVIIPSYVGEQRQKPVLAQERSPSQDKGLAPPFVSPRQISGEISIFSKQTPARSAYSTSSI